MAGQEQPFLVPSAFLHACPIGLLLQNLSGGVHMHRLSSRLSLTAIALLAAAGCSDSTAPAGSTDVSSLSSLPPNAIPVSACLTTITTPGDYWLTRDLNCTVTVAAIRIYASGTTLHLNGHQLYSIPEIAIELHGDNATVVGPGVVKAGRFPIFIRGSNNLIRGLRVVDYDLGIYDTGTNNVIRDVTFQGRGIGYAAVYVGTGTVIQRSTVIGPVENGFVGGSGALIDSNRVQEAGIAISVGTQSTVSNNLIDLSDHAIDIFGAQNTVSNNRIKRSEVGIQAEGTGNLITGNLLRDHNRLDMVDLNVDACVVNTWTNNLFLTAYPDCLQ